MLNSSELLRDDDGGYVASRFSHAHGFAKVHLMIVAARSDPLLLVVWGALAAVCGIIMFLVYRGVAG